MITTNLVLTGRYDSCHNMSRHDDGSSKKLCAWWLPRHSTYHDALSWLLSYMACVSCNSCRNRSCVDKSWKSVSLSVGWFL